MNLVNANKGLVIKKFNQFFYVDILENDESLVYERFLCRSRKSISYQQKHIFVGDKVILSEINYKDKTAVLDAVFTTIKMVKKIA